MYKNLYLKKGKEESLERFHPWIFSGAIHHIEGEPEEGEVVRVLTSEGDFIAVGHWQIGSIAVRVLDFEDKAVDGAYWEDRLRVAYDLRCAIGVAGHEKGNDTYRLVHGEGDCLPGLVVDVYGKTAVMQAHSVGMHVARHEIARALVAVTGGTVENVYYKSETTLQGGTGAGKRFYRGRKHGKRGGRERLEVSYRLVERPEDRILRRPT